MSELRDKLLTVGVLSGGRTRDVVKDGRRDDGVRTKTVTNEAGTTVEHAVPGDRLDAYPRVQTVHAIRNTEGVINSGDH